MVVNNLLLVKFGSYKEMCRKIAGEISELLQENPEALLCIAAGHTSLGLFECLAQLYEEGGIDFKNVRFVAMDEWLGMSEQNPNSCGDFLNRNFFNRLNFDPENIRLFNGATGDHEKECREVAHFIKENSKYGVIDFLVLGTGMNGHLGLNEPGCDLEAGVSVVELDETTKAVGQKYFDEETPLSGGITLGIGDFAQARRSVLMISGSHKREILQKILEGPVNNMVPATAIHGFNNANIYCDRDAYGR